MSFPFLQSLPAILGAVVYIIYLIFKKSTSHDPVIRSVIERLKFEDPGYYNYLESLSESQKERLIKSDTRLREIISERDRSILERALSNQFKTNIFVYCLCAFLVLSGIGLYIYQLPKSLKIDNITLQNTDSSSDELIVDRDPITVTWTQAGADEEVKVVLENVQTGQQTKSLRVQASEGRLIFHPDKYTNFDKIFTRDRLPNGINRVRAIFYSTKETFKSKEFEVRAGVSIIAYAEGADRIIFNAILDQTILENFWFQPRIALFEEGFNNRKIFEAETFQSQPSIKIPKAGKFDLTQLVFTVNPRDVINQKIYRTDIQSLRDALGELVIQQARSNRQTKK